MTIYIDLNVGSEEITLLNRHLTEARLFIKSQLPEGEQEEAFRAAEVALGSPPPKWVIAHKRLKWLQLNSVGFSPYVEVHEKRPDLLITNVKGMFGTPVAESALAGILALYRGIDELALLKQENHWLGSALRPHLQTLEGKSIVILGSGSIGLTLRRMLLAFRSTVRVMGRQSPEADFYALSELDAMLPETDIVICALPETLETIGLFDHKRLALLPTGALFVNVGRGSVVDEKALVGFLQEEKLAGAVLDVTEQEPLPEDHALWSMPRTVLTQHTGGGFGHEQAKKVQLFLENLRYFKQGETLKNIINFNQGY